MHGYERQTEDSCPSILYGTLWCSINCCKKKTTVTSCSVFDWQELFAIRRPRGTGGSARPGRPLYWLSQLLFKVLTVFLCLTSGRLWVIDLRDTTICVGADLRGASTLVSFNHVIDPHFAAFSNNLYTATICNPKPNPNPNLNSDPDPDRSGSGSGSNLTLTQTQTLTLTLP